MPGGLSRADQFHFRRIGNSAAGDGVEDPRPSGAPADPSPPERQPGQAEGPSAGSCGRARRVEKTSLLVQFALAAEMPVAWCRVEVSERHASAFLDHVGSAIAAALGGPAVDPSVEGVVQGIEGSRVDRLLLIDDLHVLEGSEAEQALQRLVDCAPPSLSMLAAPRRPPGLNLSRLKVSGQLLEVTAKHLRFRTWEVERLFRDFYQEPLPPRPWPTSPGGPRAGPPGSSCSISRPWGSRPMPAGARSPAGQPPAAPQLPGRQRARRAARDAPRLPGRHLRAGAAHRSAL